MEELTREDYIEIFSALLACKVLQPQGIGYKKFEEKIDKLAVKVGNKIQQLK